MLWSALIFGGVVFLTQKEVSIAVWAIVAGLTLLFATYFLSPGLSLLITGWSLVGVFALLAIKPFRQAFTSRFILPRVRRKMPPMSKTERVALEAGTVGWDAELFSGSPNFNALLAAPLIQLTDDERVFLNGPVKDLCRLIDDWDITHHHTDLPPLLWRFIKENGFLGMMIPKEYGGLELSATAQTAVLVQLYGRSVTVATTVSVPNSLGPAELLLKYGTDAQKKYYLPRLAKGLDIPCFALTGPGAGSDAASIPDTGIVCRGMIDGQEITGIRLNWNKRYITLCPVATVIGLAFRLFDPESLLGQTHDIGITCALIPSDWPGVTKGRRHFPLNTAFLNGPTQGENVFVPLDFLIGGPAMAGHGWRMLMECLSAGRAISLPSSAVGGAQVGALGSGAYARVRKQFNTPIGKFEGIEGPLARIGARTYLMGAALNMTVAAIDRGEKPSVASAILKYHTTELARQISLDAMDIHGGKGICLGPNNYLGRGYQAAPISITVEGANILTRSLIIFGQGAIRCHPYVIAEMNSITETNLPAFDEAFWGHVGFFLSNFARSIVYAVTNARFTTAPKGPLHRTIQLMHRYSTNLAFMADFSMMVLGSSLKRREKISARLGDLLSYLYLGSAVLQRFHQEGELLSDKPLLDWCCQDVLYSCEEAIHGVIDNFPVRWARWVLKLSVRPFGFSRKKPSDQLDHAVATLMLEPNDARTRLTRDVFKEAILTCPLGRLEAAFHELCAVAPLEKRVSDAVKEGRLVTLTLLQQIDEAAFLGILTPSEAVQLESAELARQQAIAVDDFDDSALRRTSVKSRQTTVQSL